MKDKWDFYKDKEGGWRWTRTAPNGEIVGASSESYTRKYNCKKNAKRNGFIE